MRLADAGLAFPLRETLRVAVPPKKSGDATEIFVGSPAKATAGARAPCPWVPREKRGRKGEKTVTEETKISQTSEASRQPASAGVAQATANTVGASVNGRPERKPLISWAALLDEAVKKPGFIHEAYSRFHNYSLGNQLLALFQCFERGIQPGPLATWPKWKELGRYVKKGEKALTLCMPVNCKRTRTVTAQDGSEQDEEFTYTHFTYKAHWFVLAQTEGAELKPAAIPGWSEPKALETLKIERIEFTNLDGKAQGYAWRGRKIAVSPIAALPHKTLFHELAHVVLGHCDKQDLSDTENTPREFREVEAEAVALLCCESLGMPGAEFSRGYS